MAAYFFFHSYKQFFCAYLKFTTAMVQIKTNSLNFEVYKGETSIKSNFETKKKEEVMKS